MAVTVASLPELDMHKSELWGGRQQEWGILNQRDALGSKQCIWSPGLDITVGIRLYLQTFMRNRVAFKIAQHWLLISRNVLSQASLVVHFVFLILIGKVTFYFYSLPVTLLFSRLSTVFCRLPPKGILLTQGMIDAVKFPFWNPLSSFRGSNRKMTWSLVWINSLLLNVAWRCIFGFWYYNIHGSSFLLLPNSYTCCQFGM